MTDPGRSTVSIAADSQDPFAETFRREALWVSEGLCPQCRERLVSRTHATLDESAAVCPSCGIGWALRPSTDDERWMGPIVLRTIYCGPWREES